MASPRRPRQGGLRSRCRRSYNKPPEDGRLRSPSEGWHEVIVVTGGAGFIGSNLVAGLEARGEYEIVVCDRLGSDQKWQNLAKREIAAFVPPDELALLPRQQRVAGPRGVPSGRRHLDDRDRRRSDPRHQLRAVAGALGPLRRARHALHLRLVGRDLWRRRRRLRRRRQPGGAGQAPAAQRLWLEQASVRPADRTPPGRAGAPARRSGPGSSSSTSTARTSTTRAPCAASSRRSCRRSRPASRRACSSRTARTIRTARRSAISSGSATAST